jgi:hypothetical protein
MSNINYIHKLVQLRTTVACLGEQTQPQWWSSGFFSPTSKAFLSPVFSRSVFLSQYHGARQAASLVHDEYIGVGGQVYHLFRLPETIEQALHKYLLDPIHSDRVQTCIVSSEQAMQTLLELSGESSGLQSESGPVRVGASDQVQQRNLWQKVARYYYAAFVQGTKTYPYIAHE